MPQPKIHILRAHNRLLIGADVGATFPGALPRRARALLEETLSYVERVFLRGVELYEAKKKGLPHTYETTWNCYVIDIKDRMGTSFGFLERIQAALVEHAYAHRLTVLRAHPHPEIFEPRWDRVFDGSWQPRYRQEELLRTIFAHENGRFDCPTAFGKSLMIAKAATAAPKAKIAVVTRSVAVLSQRLYPELCLHLPSVGIVGGGQRKRGRVTCYSAGSLHHCPDDVDIVFGDEAHQFASDDCARKMAKLKWARQYGFSASHDMRLDNKDMRCEAMFGPIRMRVTYDEGVANQMIVPILVKMANVIMDEDPCEGYLDVAKKRHGIWRNDYRNSLIAADASSYPDCQVLVSCTVIEHVLHLKKLLPDAVIIYYEGGMDADEYARFERQGLIPPDFRWMDRERKEKRIRRLEKGTPGIYIATPVLNLGVDCRYLEVVCRADAGGSPDKDIQIPGRASRTNDAGKKVGIVHDYLDQFNRGFRQLAGGRMHTYASNGWEIVFPDKASASVFRRQMGWA